MSITIGEYLKKLRKKQNMTLESLQEKSGVSNSHISRIERGLREPSPDTLKKLSTALGADYADLMDIAGYLPMDCITQRMERANRIDPATAKIKSVLSEEPELAIFWDQLSKRPDLQLLFKQTKNMSPKGVKQIIRIIQAIEEEEGK